MKSVDMDVNVTDNATSPFAINAITLEDAPPGQQPTNINPTANSVGKFNNLETTNAKAKA